MVISLAEPQSHARAAWERKSRVAEWIEARGRGGEEAKERIVGVQGGELGRERTQRPRRRGERQERGGGQERTRARDRQREKERTRERETLRKTETERQGER